MTYHRNELTAAAGRFHSGGYMAKHHYVVQTHPGHDRLACDNLREAGWETHLFTIEQELRTRRGRVKADVPLFPTYLFVAFDLDDIHWRTIASIRHVSRILAPPSDPLRPFALRDGALAELRARYADGEFIQGKVVPIAVDERVVITSGQFQGREGICKLNKGERLEIVANFFGGETRISVPAHIVERAVQ